MRFESNSHRINVIQHSGSGENMMTLDMDVSSQYFVASIFREPLFDTG